MKNMFILCLCCSFCVEGVEASMIRFLFVSRSRFTFEHGRRKGGPRPIRTGRIDPDGSDRRPGRERGYFD